MAEEFSPEVEAVLAKAEKLLRLAASNTNAEEAASAASKAQELLTAYNLSSDIVDETTGRSGARQELALKGGQHLYQRHLWKAVAKLNFCIHWNQGQVYHAPHHYTDFDGTKVKSTRFRTRQQHVMVGKKVNVVVTKKMAEYLEGAIERLVRERLQDRVTRTAPIAKQLFSAWAVSYRTGAADNIIAWLEERRYGILQEERRKQREAQDAAARSGVSTSSALVLSTYIDKETDANLDFMYGEGYSAKQATERAARAAARKQADAEYASWAAAHPEKAAKAEADRRKQERAAPARRGRTTTGPQRDASAYWSGHEAAASISIDQQVDSNSNNRRIG